MIEILLAAASVPDLLLADEPLAGLGLLWIPVAVEAIERVRASGSAVLMVIHEPERRYWNPDWTIEVVSHRGPS
jgi:ABC-type branched-subunit amino acid transport system ATPase component